MRIGGRTRAYATNLFHGALGAAIVWTDGEDHALHRLESMLKHQPLHLAVVSPAPVGSGQERPADLNDATLRIVAVVARRPDDLSGRSIQRHKRTTGRQGVLEENSERGLLIAIWFRMLLPDEGICGDPEQRLEIARP